MADNKKEGTGQPRKPVQVTRPNPGTYVKDDLSGRKPTNPLTEKRNPKNK